MKKLLVVLFIMSPLFMFSQSSNFTATVQDPSGQLWANGTYTASIYSPNGPPTFNNVPIPTAQQTVSGLLDSNGVMSGTLYDTNQISPSGAKYSITVCPNASFTCANGLVSVVGSSPNLTSAINSFIPSIKFSANGSGAYGYNDSEVSPTPKPGGTYFNVTLSAIRVWDGNAWSSTSGASSYNNILNAVASFPVLNGMTAFYALNEPTGTPPVDYSGNKNTAILPGGSANPTGTSQGLSFSSSTVQYFTLPSAVSSSARTYLSLMCQAPLNIGGASPIGWNNPVFAASTAANGPIANLMGVGPNFGQAWGLAMGVNNASNFVQTNSISMGKGCGVYFWVFSNTSDMMGVDGNEVQYINHVASGSSVGVGGLINIGTSSQITTGNLYGTVRSLAIFNRELSLAEIQQESVSMWTLGVQLGLNYPLRANLTTTDRLICLGDSITNGQGVTNSYCTTAVMPSLIGAPQVTKQAVSGIYLRALSERSQFLIGSLNNSNATRNTAVLFACTNDIALRGETGATCFNNTADALQQLRTGDLTGYSPVAPKWRTLLIPMLSRSGADAGKNSLDTLMNTNWQTVSDYYVAPTDPLLWADGAYANLTYFQDGIHPTQVGQNLLGTYVQNTYNKANGSTASSHNITAAATYTIAAADGYLDADNSGGVQTLTLPSCKGFSTGFTIYTLTSANIVTLKTAAASETINGTDYSTVGLTLAGSSVVTILPSFKDPATATCVWVVGN